MTDIERVWGLTQLLSDSSKGHCLQPNVGQGLCLGRAGHSQEVPWTFTGARDQKRSPGPASDHHTELLQVIPDVNLSSFTLAPVKFYFYFSCWPLNLPALLFKNQLVLSSLDFSQLTPVCSRASMFVQITYLFFLLGIYGWQQLQTAIRPLSAFAVPG